MPDQHQILLRTKLHRPRLPNDLVTRTRLIERLNHEIEPASLSWSVHRLVSENPPW